MVWDGTENDEIVSLKRYKSTMHHSAISQLEAYWLSLRAGRVVPDRADVDPRGIDRALEFAFILERIAPGMARFRLAGMHLNDLMGLEVRGMPITSFFVPDARRQVGDMLEKVFETPSIARLDLAGERGLGRPATEAAMLILPLKSDLGDVSRAMGCLICQGEVGRTPRRFSIDTMGIEPLKAGVDPSGVEMPQASSIAPLPDPEATPDAAPSTPETAPAEPGFAEPRPGFAGKRPGAPRGKATKVPWLRVVDADDS